MNHLAQIDADIKTHFGGSDCPTTRSRKCCPTTNVISSITNCGDFMTQIAETYTFCKWLANGSDTSSCSAVLTARNTVRRKDPKIIYNYNATKRKFSPEVNPVNKRPRGGGGIYDGTSLDCYGITKLDNTFPMAHFFAVLRDDTDVAYLYNAYGSECIKNPGTSRQISKSQLKVYIQRFNVGEKDVKDVKDEKDKQEFIQWFASNPVDFFDHDTEKLVSATTADNEWSGFILPNKSNLQIVSLPNYQSNIESIFNNSIEANQVGGRKQKRKSKRKRRTRRTRRRKRTKTRRRRKK